MIGKIAGRLEYRGADHVLVDVRGVGYIVYVSDRTLAAMPRVGEAVALFTELLVREDLLQLFGFPTMLEKEWHKLLVTVQGVGAKAAMAVLGTLGPEGVARAIALGDAKAIQAAPGVGPKIAQRVVLELKSKAPAVMAMGANPASMVGAVEDDVIEPMAAPKRAAKPDDGAKAVAASAAAGRAAASAEALSALINLGYQHGDAAQAVAQAAGEAPEAGTGLLIKAALKLLAPKG
ncbi:Holliday junction branch migration protein RuvA [Pseudorhodobacter sp. W20_MBD10_FR17]|uniref:Holliday junction branch migration protein RuvA n=1 Tax=Pseudorhodobacter sp. W20_MBD10_FR17 TaxID=3240266 RepID=UPI003F97C5DB